MMKMMMIKCTKFDVHVTVHRNKFLIIEPNRCTNFSEVFLFWNETLHVLDSFSIHHQEFLLYTQQTCMTYTIAVCTVKTS
jgi:hypothetical protein